MNKEDYPTLFRDADEVSLRAQKNYYLSITCYLILLVTASIMSLYGINSKTFAIIAAFLFLATIATNIFILTKRNNEIWYNARAVVESVRTITWKFIMRAEPFDSAGAERRFLEILNNIINQNKNLLLELSKVLTQHHQITEKMKEIRNMSVKERFDFYLKHRVEDQLKWYSKKAKENSKSRTNWFILMIGLQTFAVIFVLCRIAWPEFKYWPPEVLAVASGGILTWIHVKKFQDLSSAYSLAAYEISIIKAGATNINTEEDLSNFVLDTENAFSREHTQWIARKDH